MNRDARFVDLQVVEVSAFVAAPFAGLTLAQLGADVIRVDPKEGGLDYRRWPIAPDGTSLYWVGLNRMKRSFAADVRDERIQAVVRQLVISGAERSGILLTNVSPHWLSYDRLRSLRDDVIVVEIEGNPDGSPAVDYTVNAAVGFPVVTGENEHPINHVFPGWDLLAGSQAAFAVMAAAARRLETGLGSHVRIALSDVAITATTALGMFADVEVNGHDRAPDGNYLYGSYGKDFPTADGRRVMVVAITPRQWSALLEVTGSREAVATIEGNGGYDFSKEGDRFLARAAITKVLAGWFAARPLSQIARALTEAGACWGPYQSARQALMEDQRLGPTATSVERVDHGPLGSFLAPLSPIRAEGRIRPEPTVHLGADTNDVLRELGLESAEIDDFVSAELI